jgi:hypothetical protein
MEPALRRKWNMVRWSAVLVYMLMVFSLILLTVIFPGDEDEVAIAVTAFTVGGIIPLLIILNLPYILYRRKPQKSGAEISKVGRKPRTDYFHDSVPMKFLLYFGIPFIIFVSAVILITGNLLTIILLSGVLLFIVLLFIIFYRLEIESDGNTIRFHWGPVGKTMNVREIRSIEKTEIRPIRDYMGYGWRIGPDGSIGYISGSRVGVRIVTKEGRTYVVSCTRPGELVSLVRRHMTH